MINYTALPESKGHNLALAKLKYPVGGFDAAIHPKYIKEDMITVMQLKSGQVPN